MKTGFVIGRVGDTEVRLHISMLLLFLFALPESGQNLTLSLFIDALLFVLAVFACILLHELAHTLVARAYKIPVRSITLWIMGGLADLTQDPPGPLSALLIAAAGPLTNILLGVALMIFLFTGAFAVGFMDFLPSRERLIDNQMTLLLLRLALANLVLAVFNLIPIYPMDGGRILQAILHAVIGEARGNRVMLVISLLLVFAMGAYGVYSGSYTLMVLSIFLGFGALSLNRRSGGAPARRGVAGAQQDLEELKAGYYDEVVVRASAALEHNPNQVVPLVNRAIAYLELEELDLATRDLARVQMLNPRHPAPYALRAVAAGLRGDFERAMLDIEQAITMQPNLAANYINRGWLFSKMGQWESALKDLDEALRLNPGSANALTTRSLIRYRLGNLTGSQADCEQALQTEPQEAQVFTAIFLKNLHGNLDWAQAYYRWIEARVPRSPRLWQGRGDALRVNGQLQEAIVEYSRALQVLPNEAAIYLGRGMALLESNDPQRAAQDFQKVLKMSPKSHLRRQAKAILESISSSPGTAAVA